jgi:branched-chain amino acid transport system permease protein
MRRLRGVERGTSIVVVLGLALLIGLPRVADTYAIRQATLLATLSLYTLSLAYIWGYGGIMCFGQAAFFGAGAYTFAVAAIDLGDSTIPLILSIIVPAMFAAALGYFMFYGRLSDVYMGIVTLLTTLICGEVMSQTAGPDFAIGQAMLGGFNGIPSVPSINVPGDPTASLETDETFQLVIGTVILVYFGLKTLQRTSFGRITAAVRENEARASLLGYDIRLHKVVVFSIGGGIAGLAGAFFASHQLFIDPNLFSLSMAAQCIIWVMLGGLGTLIGPIIACCGLQFLTTWLSSAAIANNSFILGIILINIVLLLPSGLLPGFRAWAVHWIGPAWSGEHQSRAPARLPPALDGS